MRSFRCGVFSAGKRGKDGVRSIYKRSQFVEMADHAEDEMGALAGKLGRLIYKHAQRKYKEKEALPVTFHHIHR